MLDWDGDGKETWKDDYVYHEVFETKTTGSTPFFSGKASAGSGKTVVILLMVWFVWEMLNLTADMMY